MAQFKLKVNGIEAVVKNIKEIDRSVRKELVNELNAFGFGTVSDAKRAAPVDEGTLRNSISATQATPQDLRVTISVNVDYAAWLEFGTRSFAAAYVSSLPTEWQVFAAQFKGGGGGTFQDFVMRLQRWCKLKLGDDKLAYVVARSILIKGIRPHPYFVPAVEKNKIELIRRLKALL